MVTTNSLKPSLVLKRRVLRIYQTVVSNKLLKRVFGALSLAFLWLSAFSQATTQVHDVSAVERDFQFKLFENRFAEIPSLINQGNLKQFAYGEANYLYAEGTLRHPQDYKAQRGIRLKTASLASLKKTNWTFYGSFEYLNTSKENVENNLTYGVRAYDSPYYLFQNTSGLWEHQNYNFSVSAVNQVNTRLSLGGDLNYSTHLYYRKVDTRNELTALKIEGSLSASYQFTPKQVLSVALRAGFFKTDSELRNKFPENNTELTANRYLNAGLGSYIKNIEQGFETKRNTPGVQLHWYGKYDHWDISVQSTTKVGREAWTDNSILREEQNNVLTKYNFTSQQIRVLYNKYYKRKQLMMSIAAEYLKGDGNIWEANLSDYYKNFLTERYEIEAQAEILFQDQLVNKIGLKAKFYNREQLDLNYAYQFDYQWVVPEVSVALHQPISPKVSSFVNLSTLYHQVLEVKHSPRAARNIFVDWIGRPVADFVGTSLWNFNTKLGLNFSLKNKTTLAFSVSSSYWKVAGLSEEIAPRISKNDDYLEVVVNARLFF